MADSAKITLGLDVSERTDYLRPYLSELITQELTPDETVCQKVETGLSAITVSLSHLASITTLIVQNTDASNSVDVEWYESIGSQALIPVDTWNFADPGTDDTITDNAANGSFITNGSAAGRYVRVENSESAQNDGTFLIQSTTGDIITLTSADNLTANATDASATLNFDEKHTTRLTAGGLLVVTASVVPNAGVALTRVAGNPVCKVVVLGT